MKRNVLFSTIAATLFSMGMALPAFAQPGVLTTQERGSQINVRSEASTQSDILHYGVSGDWVTVLDVIECDDGYIWFYVKFDASNAEGWIRGDFLQLKDYRR
jgi:uncharacterized protein YgiM (DUF1202 family)